MTINFDNIQTFTDAEMLKLVRYAITQIMTRGGSYSVAGRTFTSASLNDLRALEREYDARVAASSGPTIARGRFNRAQ